MRGSNSDIIIGGSGHAVVLLDLIAITRPTMDVEHAIVKEFSNQIKATFPELEQYIQSDDEYIDNHQPSLAINGIGIPGNSTIARHRVYSKYKTHGWSFPTLVHPSAIVSPRAALAEGSQVMAGAIIQAISRVGENTIVNTGARIDHGCDIGAHSMIGPGATLCGDVSLGQNVIIGAGAVILPGVRVPDGKTIPANSRLTAQEALEL